MLVNKKLYSKFICLSFNQTRTQWGQNDST